MSRSTISAPGCRRRGVMLGIALAFGSIASSPGSSAPVAAGGVASGDGIAADVDDYLVRELRTLAPGATTTVMVHGTNIAASRRAATASGMRVVTTFDKIGVAVARGTSTQIAAAGNRTGVTYLEGNTPIAFSLATSNIATRGARAVSNRTGANGLRLNGSGVSVAVIDSGIDPTHPFFRKRAVVANLKSLCADESNTDPSCVVRVPNNVDTDTSSGGGHGTHVSGIVAGRPVTLTDGTRMQGAAPGAKLVSISTGAVLLIVGADSALNWVLENHDAPCGPGIAVATCPPIKVTNNSYGPIGGGSFDPRSATVKLQRALLLEGVVTVWAAGNDGGDGSESLTNPPGQDPKGGIISVASYFDRNTGTRAGAISEYSSRGNRAQPSTWPDISAPGEDITSSCRPTQPICSTGGDPRNGPEPTDLATFNTISGTSMAAPHIAGITAQLFQADPTATPFAIEAALKSTAHRYTNGAPYSRQGNYLTSFDKGTGLVDVIGAVDKITA